MSEIKERLEREWRYIAESPRPIFGGFHDRVIQLAKDSLKFLASVPSVAQQPQPRLTPPWDTFKGPTCRGSYLLGSACGNCDRCKWELAQCEYKPASAPVQEEKCPTCTSANKEDRYWRYAKGDHPYSKWHWKNGECEDEPPCEPCADLWHSSGISEVSQPSADPCNHEVGRTITCRLGTLGCSIHEPEQKVAEPMRMVIEGALWLKVVFGGYFQIICENSVLLFLGENGNKFRLSYLLQAYAAEQTASLRSQLQDEFNDRLNAASVDYVRVKKALEVAESALCSREAVAIDYTEEAIALEEFINNTAECEFSLAAIPTLAAWLRSHDQKLRGRESATIERPEILEYLWREQGCPGAAQEFSKLALRFDGSILADVIERWEKWREERGARRESVAIDYDTEIATFNFIVSATDTDHGYDIDKAKAAVWLRKFSQKLRGQSVEKGLVDALGGLLSVLAEPMPGNLQEYTFAYDRALTSYRQATQPQTESTKP